MRAWITRDARNVRELWLEEPRLLNNRYYTCPRTGSIWLMPDMLPEFQPATGKPIVMTLIVCEVQE